MSLDMSFDEPSKLSIAAEGVLSVLEQMGWERMAEMIPVL
jgi:hypothetical protein